jgi:hypothetical protein
MVTINDTHKEEKADKILYKLKGYKNGFATKKYKSDEDKLKKQKVLTIEIEKGKEGLKEKEYEYEWKKNFAQDHLFKFTKNGFNKEVKFCIQGQERY